MKLPIAIPQRHEYWLGLFEERAGILEYMANMDRETAERIAAQDIRHA